MHKLLGLPGLFPFPQCATHASTVSRRSSACWCLRCASACEQSHVSEGAWMDVSNLTLSRNKWIFFQPYFWPALFHCAALFKKSWQKQQQSSSVRSIIHISMHLPFRQATHLAKAIASIRPSPSPVASVSPSKRSWRLETFFWRPLFHWIRNLWRG